MRKIINKKLYETETAILVASWWNEYPVGDFNSVHEVLYKKRSGEYFLHGEGGAMSKYAKSHGDNSWGGGEEIIPLSYEAAQKWAEKKADPSIYEQEFGPVAEDDSVNMTTIRVTNSTAEKLKKEASKRGCTIGEVVAQLLKQM